MLFDPYQKLQHQVARLRQQIEMSNRSGPVEEIKEGDDGEQKVRICYAQGSDGKKVLSPWLHITQHRGQGRERKPINKGQNMRMTSVGADYSQAYATPGPENESNPPPDHSKTHGLGSKTYQSGKLHETYYKPDESQGGSGGGTGSSGGSGGGNGKYFYETYIAEEDNKPPAHQGGVGKRTESQGTYGSQVGGSGQQNQQEGKKSQSKEPKPMMKTVMDEESKAMAFCYGKENDVYCDDSHSRLRTTDGNVIFTDKQGVWSTKPIRIKKPPKKEHPRAVKP